MFANDDDLRLITVTNKVCKGQFIIPSTESVHSVFSQRQHIQAKVNAAMDSQQIIGLCRNWWRGVFKPSWFSFSCRSIDVS